MKHRILTKKEIDMLLKLIRFYHCKGLKKGDEGWITMEKMKNSNDWMICIYKDDGTERIHWYEFYLNFMPYYNHHFLYPLIISR